MICKCVYLQIRVEGSIVHVFRDYHDVLDCKSKGKVTFSVRMRRRQLTFCCLSSVTHI